MLLLVGVTFIEHFFENVSGALFVAHVDIGAGEVQLVAHTGNAGEEQPTLKQESWNLEKGDALAAEVASFVESILENKPCEVSGHDGVAALELAEEIIADIERREF